MPTPESAMPENAMEDAELPDVSALGEWIGDRLPGEGPFTLRRFGQESGMANALYVLGRDGHEWVLRRPPAVKNDPSAGNTVREWRILRALHGTPVPHPAARLLCEDAGVVGATFLIMDFVDGFVPGVELPSPFNAVGQERLDLGMAYVDGLVELSKVDWRSRGLEGLGKPEGFLERQVPRWLAQLDRYRTRDLPELDFVCDWLEQHRPQMSEPAILHGDYSPYNVLVAHDPPARLAAILDWDTGTIGDPLVDIGHLLARWPEPDEEPLPWPPPGALEPGWPTRAAMAERYAAGTGRDLSALAYYECLALFKLAVILEGGHARAVAQGVPERGDENGEGVPHLVRAAAAIARGERR
jgi:aminoglycoside phosphotransferase (APT) family kinase protein